MTDLRIDYAALGVSARDVREIAGRFGEATGRREAAQDCWGSDRVRDAMETFEQSWRRHRRLLAEELEEFAGRVETAVTAFQKTDGALGTALEQAGERSTAPAPHVWGPR